MKAIAGSRTSRSYRRLFSWNQGRLLLSANCSRNSKSVGWNLSNFIMGAASAGLQISLPTAKACPSDAPMP